MLKEVHLNEAQYKTTGLVLGGFEKKNLSEVINANGYTKLPPQNQAQVSVQISGTISTIKVIEGQAVKAGQVLATMQSMAYNNLRLEREKLNQELTASQSNLEFPETRICPPKRTDRRERERQKGVPKSQFRPANGGGENQDFAEPDCHFGAKH
jgi:multidrug efflux pump subunit AcrA (membrane-fusion protein)